MSDARLARGLRLAAGTFTVLPVRAGPADRSAAAVAMAAAPWLGLALGALLGAAALGLRAALPSPLLVGALVWALAALLTRGLHLDGLADTVDALGSYRRGDAGLAVMKRADIGPFGVAALAGTLLVQAAALGALADRPAVPLLAGVAAAHGAGRLAVAYACRRGVPAARPAGLGALVAGTVGPLALAAGTLAVLAAAVPAVPGRWWQGPAAAAAALALGLLLVRHAVRRFGGVTGDVLGAAVEVTTAATLVALLLG
ncbi:adenosylcobinamide-GDP ribazoletransferase [Pilimelia anulata]|uniref:Adenosylcobinamide-GDP ribazoletransferase n=1 Tax=Pilimelia anulata TaxID=53371 RepID=A0A8J3B0V3_9ACTN|nr:adenosylcobinamide-GDP ribazoletransferase [Pilimelia anulata]GGJ84794.1 adenosylcobinamide-GDP ribazoletransferase [Pilimelia anulata]